MSSQNGATPARSDDLMPADPLHPDAEFMQRELDRDRSHERVLVPKALLALVLVAVLVAIRQVFFV
jgi:hypothetical protein